MPLGPQPHPEQQGTAGSGLQPGRDRDRRAGGHRLEPHRQAALGQRRGVDLEADVGGRRLDDRVEQPIPKALELQGVEQPLDLHALPGADPKLVDVHRQRHVAPQDRELLVAQHVVAVGEQVVAQLAALLAGVLDHALGGAVRLHQPGGGLVPHPRHPGQVVGRVAAERGDVDVALRRHTVAIQHGGGVVDARVGDTAGGHHHLDAGLVVDELEGVAVAADDHHRHAPLGRLAHQRGDDVVGLVARHLDDGDVQGVEHLADQRHLRAELDGGRLPVRLVLGVDLVAVGGPTDVEADGDAIRGDLTEQLHQHGGEAVDRVGLLPGGGRQITGQREERSVGEAVPVQQHQRPRRLARLAALGRSGVLGLRA